LSAVKAGQIREISDIMSSAGIRIDAIRPAALSVADGFRYGYPELRESTLIVEIGTRSTHVVLAEGVRQFARTVSFGLEATSPASASDAAENECASRLVGELVRTIAFARRQVTINPPTALLLATPDLRFAALSEVLGEILSLPVQRYDPLRRIEVMEAQAFGGARPTPSAVLIGCAVNRHARSGSTINLLPRVAREERARLRRRRWFVATAAIVAASLVIPFLFLGRRSEQLHLAIERGRPRLREAKRIQAANVENFARLSYAQRELADLEKIKHATTSWLGFFGGLQDALAAVGDTWLDGFRFVARPTESSGSNSAPIGPEMLAQRVRVTGWMLDRLRPTEKVSAEVHARGKQLLANIAKTSSVRAIEDERFDYSRPGLVRFEFTIVLDPKTPL
jgi:type IV pilus assembly protein PilM